LLQIFKNKKFLLFIGLIFLLITWVMFTTSHSQRAESKAEYLLNSVFTPLEQVFSYSSKTVNDSWKTIAELGRLKVINQKLRAELDLLKVRLLSYANLEAENQKLRDALRFEQSQIHRLIAAEIIAVSPNNWDYTFVINKGANYGIQKGWAVISPDGVVGRVGAVRSGSAEVILVTDAREGNYVGGVLKRTNNLVIVRGGGDNRGECTINPAIDSYFFNLKKGDLIVTSAASEKFPSGIPIGKVNAINKGSNKMVYRAMIKPIVNLGKLQFVYVVKMKPRKPENIGPKELKQLIPTSSTPASQTPVPTAELTPSLETESSAGLNVEMNPETPAPSNTITPGGP
jgi:rod shape-determining protein MreC